MWPKTNSFLFLFSFPAVFWEKRVWGGYYFWLFLLWPPRRPSGEDFFQFDDMHHHYFSLSFSLLFWWNEWLLFLFSPFYMNGTFFNLPGGGRGGMLILWKNHHLCYLGKLPRLPPPSFLGKWLISQTETLYWKIPLLSLFFWAPPPPPLKSFAWINEILAPPPPLFPPLFNCPCVLFQAEITWLC